jgi:hypothetical protein
MKVAWSLAVAGAVLACGGGSSGGGGGGGGGGGSFTQIGFVIPATDCPPVSVAGVVVLVSTNRTIANACTQASNACVEYANLNGIALTVANFDSGGTAPAVTPETYPLSSTPSGSSGTLAFASVEQTDASCNSTGPSGTPTGSITVTTVSATAVTGSYDVTVDTQHFTGTFDATLCSSGSFLGDVCNGGGGTCTGTMQCL